ncbi:integrase, catalytic region, zinc finger, CCHC-type containing protein [Tanacetum coccineum]
MIPDSEETLMLAEERHSKMLLKQKDPIMLEKKVNTAPVDYAVLNQLSQDFEKRFVPQTELSAEQTFWSQNSINSAEPTLSSRPTKVEVPKELPKVIMVNTSLKKLKHHLVGFDVVVKERTTATTITEGSWGDNSVSNQSAPNFDQLFELHELKAQSQEKDTVIKNLKERIKSLSGKMNEDKIKKDLEEIETINIELDHRVSKLIAENENLKQTYKKLYDSIKPVDLVDNDVTKHPSDPEMLKIDMEPITPKLLNQRTAHSAYIKHTQEEAAVLKDLVDHVKIVLLNLKELLMCNSKLNANSELKRVKCNGCMLYDNHDLCVLDFINNMNAHTKSKSVKKHSKRKVWKLIGKVFTNIGYIWRPTGRTFVVVGNACPLTRITTTAKVPLRKPTALDNETSKPVVILVYLRKPRKSKTNVPVSKVLKSVSANKNGKLVNLGDLVFDCFISSLDGWRLGLFRSRVYYHGVDLLMDLEAIIVYSVLLEDMMASSPICLLSKASKTKSWLWPPTSVSSELWNIEVQDHLLFQLLFDELLTPPPSVDYPTPEVVAPIHEVVAPVHAISTGSSSSTNVEPKTYKDALTQSCWIEAMQEELNEFERLEVWELVLRSDKVMVITLKWIYKVNINKGMYMAFLLPDTCGNINKGMYMIFEHLGTLQMRLGLKDEQK